MRQFIPIRVEHYDPKDSQRARDLADRLVILINSEGKKATMPHDRDGVKLELNDLVYVPAYVTQLSAEEDYCNCTLKTAQRMKPTDHPTTIVLNTVQVIKGDRVKVEGRTEP